jgi:hypothetical protein
MNLNRCESRLGCLKHGIVSPAHGRIVPFFFQAPLRCLRKFFRFFKAHVATNNNRPVLLQAMEFVGAAMSLPK